MIALTQYLFTMYLFTTSTTTAFAHQRSRYRQRQGRCVRLLNLPLPCNQRPLPRPLQGYSPDTTETGVPPTTFRLGGYTLGDENCPLLYGPTDLRY